MEQLTQAAQMKIAGNVTLKVFTENNLPPFILLEDIKTAIGSQDWSSFLAAMRGITTPPNAIYVSDFPNIMDKVFGRNFWRA